MVAGAISEGDILLKGIGMQEMAAVAAKLSAAGVRIQAERNGIRIRAKGRPRATDIRTMPYPGFPTDLQAQFLALMLTARGAAMISETIFENRFMHVPELLRMGANINVHGHASAIVRGVDKLYGAPVMATDLRASFALILAGLAAEGETIVNRVYHLDRGYERLEEKLKAVQLLIDHGIDVNWLNSRFETALMMALNQIEIEVAEVLIDNGGIVYQPPKRPKEQNTEEENKE